MTHRSTFSTPCPSHALLHVLRPPLRIIAAIMPLQSQIRVDRSAAQVSAVRIPATANHSHTAALYAQIAAPPSQAPRCSDAVNSRTTSAATSLRHRTDSPPPPTSSASPPSVVITLCATKETVHLALEILDDIPKDEEAMKREIGLYADVVHALCEFEDFDATKQLILKKITSYARAGEMGQATEMVKLMETRGFKPDLNTCLLLMEEAGKILEEAKKQHSELSSVVVYHTLIHGYCNLLVKDFGAFPNVDEGLWEMAKKLQEEMKENGLYQQGPA